MVVVTRSQAGRAAAHDLQRARATTLKTNKKKKVATAPVRAGIQKRKRSARSSARAEVPKAALAKKTLGEASFILKLKKEAFGARDLWKHRYAPVGALERWLKAKEKEAKAEEAAQPRKTKMVVKTRVTHDYIVALKMLQPALLKDLPDEHFADKPESFRHRHAMHMYMNKKMHAYHQALIDQYISKGYAEDESEDEVTIDGEQD